MGVHDGNYSAAKEALGIPESEPIFVIRAQDALALPAIARYQVLAMEAECPTDFINGLNESMAQIMGWQTDNAGFVKKPD